MITVYSLPTSVSCRKAKRWLNEREINFSEVILSKEKIPKDALKDVFALSSDIDDIIAKRSKIYKDYLGEAIDSMSFDQLLSFVIDNPTVLKTPIIYDEKGRKLNIGYNEEEITTFIPRNIRLLNYHKTTEMCI